MHLRGIFCAASFAAYLDVHDNVKGEHWQDRLRALIERADTVFFLMNPDSVASSICELEVVEAESYQKRRFPEGDKVARNRDTRPDQAGCFNGATHLSYSCQNGDRYRVTVTILADREVGVAARDLRCASASTRIQVLAIVDATREAAATTRQKPCFEAKIQ
jgi:hypothetical protein